MAALVPVVGLGAAGGCASTLPGPPDGGPALIVEASDEATPRVTYDAGVETGASE